MGKNKVNIPITAETSGFDRAVASVNNSIGSIATTAAKAVAATFAVSKGLDAMIATGSKIVEQTSKMEAAAVQWEVLAGSASDAKKILSELKQFAASTPFEFPEIQQASKVLYTFGGEALATGKSLEKLGDLAAASGQPITELATHYGRLYDAINSGRPFGESASRLQELGLLSSKARGQLEEMQKAGSSATEMWKYFGEETGKVDGMMGKMSTTMQGLMSTLSDEWNGIFDLSENKAVSESMKGTVLMLTGLIQDIKQPLQEAFVSAANLFGETMQGWLYLIRDEADYLTGKTNSNLSKSLVTQFKNNSQSQNQRLLTGNMMDMAGLERQKKELEDARDMYNAGKKKAAGEIYSRDGITGGGWGFSDKMKELDVKINDTKLRITALNEVLAGAVTTKKKLDLSGGGKLDLSKPVKSINDLLSKDMQKLSNIEQKRKEGAEKIAEDYHLAETKIFTEVERANNEAAELSRADAAAKLEREEIAMNDEYELMMLHYQNTESIISNSMSFMANTISIWKNQSLDTFQKVIGSLQGAGQGVGSIGGLLGLGANVMNPIALATAVVGGVGAIYSALKSDSSSSSSSQATSGGYDSSSTSRTNIQRTGPETVYNSYYNTINTQYADTDGFRAFVRAIAAEINRQNLRTA